MLGVVFAKAENIALRLGNGGQQLDRVQVNAHIGIIGHGFFDRSDQSVIGQADKVRHLFRQLDAKHLADGSNGHYAFEIRGENPRFAERSVLIGDKIHLNYLRSFHLLNLTIIS